MTLAPLSVCLDLWVTLDPSQETKIKESLHQFFPNAKVTTFYWETSFKDISNKIKGGEHPDILLTGHTYIPFISSHLPDFYKVSPLFWDVRVLYIWGKKSELPVNHWSDILYFLQTHGNLISFPKNWDNNQFYNYLSFFNDQLPFWLNTSPFSSQNMIYTTRLIEKLQNNYSSLFRDNPVDSFLKHDTQAIISGVWMYNHLKAQDKPFKVYSVPQSKNGIKAFKGAYVSVQFNEDINTTQAIKRLHSYTFQSQTWEQFGQLPTNPELIKFLQRKDSSIKTIFDISKDSRWATSVDPEKLGHNLRVLNYLLKNPKFFKKASAKKLMRLFHHPLYFNIFRTFPFI
jgi:hypothetical protein